MQYSILFFPLLLFNVLLGPSEKYYKIVLDSVQKPFIYVAQTL